MPYKVNGNAIYGEWGQGYVNFIFYCGNEFINVFVVLKRLFENNNSMY